MTIAEITETLEQYLTHLERISVIIERWVKGYNTTVKFMLVAASSMSSDQLDELSNMAQVMDRCREEMIEALENVAQDVTKMGKFFLEFEKENTK